MERDRTVHRGGDVVTLLLTIDETMEILRATNAAT